MINTYNRKENHVAKMFPKRKREQMDFSNVKNSACKIYVCRNKHKL